MLLVRSGINYIDRFAVTALYFAAGSVVTGRLFWSVLEPRVRLIGWEHLAMVLGAVAVYFGVHRWLRATRTVRPEVIERYPHIYWLRLDDRYIVSKTFEILFQQVMVWTLTLLLAREGLGLAWVIGSFMILFALVHVPIMRLVGEYFGRYYLVSSLVAAVVFPVVILRWQDGCVYSYVLHMGYYVASTAWFGIRWGSKQ